MNLRIASFDGSFQNSQKSTTASEEKTQSSDSSEKSNKSRKSRYFFTLKSAGIGTEVLRVSNDSCIYIQFCDLGSCLERKKQTKVTGARANLVRT